jgi:asparagine synthase (glutamine-hydrolysing)
MCGLAGVYQYKGNFDVTPKYLTKIRDTMIHRGPDAAGIWISDNKKVGLAHRRLSIIDLSDSATQPMSNSDGSVQIVFNGEIYNHQALRKELTAEFDINWKTDHSDTEVIIRAYEAWGIDCLNKLRGMFAIAIWDTKQRKLWLVRDRFGIKPLYWSNHHGRIVFASEIKAILADPHQRRSVNRPAIADYLAFICTPAPKTLFEGINKLEPGTWLCINENGNIKNHRWYEVWDHVNPSDVSNEKDIYEQVYEKLHDSVSIHKESDVPLGVFLSGGLDSSANAMLFSENSQSAINTFSIGYDANYKTYTSELPYAKQMAEKVGANYHEKILTEKDFMDFLPRMIHLQDEPIADPVCMPVYYVSKLARDNGVKVCQVGEGADELFWGYKNWKQWQKFQHHTNNSWAHLLATPGVQMMKMTGMSNSRFYDALSRSSKRKPIFWSSAQGPSSHERELILGSNLRKELKGLDGWSSIEPLWNRFQSKAWDKSALNWMSFTELSLRIPELLLMRVDKMSMGASLEARVPFLDHEFVELALSIPESIKMKNNESKHVLKQSMRGRLPENIIDRPKRGFGVPVNEWLGGKLGASIEKELNHFCKSTGIFDIRGIEAMLKSRNRVRVWYLYNFALWHRHFIEEISQEELFLG